MQRLDLTDPAARDAGLADLERLRDEAQGDDRIDSDVDAILRAVRTGGDAAVVDFGERFDGVRCASLRLPDDELARIADLCDPVVVAALHEAADRIRAFHRPQLPQGFVLDGGQLELRVHPLACVGLYVPGGRAAYPSTVLMTAVPAIVAGVKRVCVATPPQRPGRSATIIAPAIAAACRIAGVTDVFTMGGAHAVGAFAYGTERRGGVVPRVDKICGPGNAWVAAAKRKVAGVVGIDLFAGPSEVLVCDDGRATPDEVATDLIAQAEHDPRAIAVCATTSTTTWNDLPAAVERALAARDNPVARQALAGQGRAVLVNDLQALVDVAQRFAPEHLEWLAEPTMTTAITSAGAIFVGRFTPEPVGDYFAGPNHTLPTAGTSRFASGLSTTDFVKKTHVIAWDEATLRRHGEKIAALADSEGLPGHAEAVRHRLREKIVTSNSSAKPEAAEWAVPGVRSQKAYTLEAPSDVPVKLNQNEAEDDLPTAVKDKVLSRYRDIGFHRYAPFAPDALVQKIAARDGWRADGTLLGAGSNELLVALFRTVAGPGERVLMPTPCFSIYPLHLALCGADVERLPLSSDDDYAFDVDALVRRARAAKVVLVGSPNNPTGSVLPKGAVQRLLDETNALVIVDEAYREFSPEPDAAPLLSTTSRLALLRTFSKARGMGGMRLGVLMADPGLVTEVRKVLLPYTVSTFTAAAAEIVLDEPGLIEGRAQRAIAERARVAAVLRARGRRVIEGGANFVLMASSRPVDEFRALLGHGVLVRDTSLATPGFLRVSIGSAAHNDRFLAALDAVLAAGDGR
jgi:histidinol dehydrogenase